MSQAIKSINTPLGAASGNTRGPIGEESDFSLINYLPALLPLIGAALMVTARIKVGAGRFRTMER